MYITIDEHPQTCTQFRTIPIYTARFHATQYLNNYTQSYMYHTDTIKHNMTTPFLFLVSCTLLFVYTINTKYGSLETRK